jgi:23S rRNA (uracil1939-C5)-methyltransferase
MAPIASAAPDADPALVGRRRARFVVDGGRLSYSARDSHERVRVSDCAALHPALRRALLRVATVGVGFLRDGLALRLACDERGRVSAALEGGTAREIELLVSWAVCDGAIALDDVDEHEIARAGDPLLLGEITAGAVPAAASDAGVFAQATRFGGDAILREVMRAVTEVSGGVANRNVLELFAGAGHLTLPLLLAGACVDAVEGSARAVEYLNKNIAALDEPVRKRALVRRRFIDHALPIESVPKVVVADPPRTGIPELAGLMKRLAPARLVMVSCDVATGARDLAIAMAHGYALDRLLPINAFPRTSHVEWVATLVRAP